jgi:SAM-dependent methyltransferase
VTPRPSFDRLAPLYHLLERLSFGPLLHRCRTAHLPRLAGCRYALILGDGDGRFLADLLRANPAVRVDSLDISPGMIDLARERVRRIPGALDRVQFVTADARMDPLPGSGYDLVVTNFFLDCFGPADLDRVIDRVAAACGPTATWVDGDFRAPAGGWPWWAMLAALAVMYLFFRVVTRLPASRLIDPSAWLAARGFRLSAESSWLRGGLTSRLWVRSASVRYDEGIPTCNQPGGDVRCLPR